MQIMAINFIYVNFIYVNIILISLQRYYIESCNRNTIVPAAHFPLYCSPTNNLSRYNNMYQTIQNMVLPPWQSTAFMTQPQPAGLRYIKFWYPFIIYVVHNSNIEQVKFMVGT